MGTVPLAFIKFLILKEENTNWMLRFLEHRLTKVRTLRWMKLGKARPGSLKYKVQLPSGILEVLHGVDELLTLSRYVLIILFI